MVKQVEAEADPLSEAAELLLALTYKDMLAFAGALHATLNDEVDAKITFADMDAALFARMLVETCEGLQESAEETAAED